MRFVLFYHSLISDWNHGNAHFLRGVSRELQARGHQVDVFEPARGWSLRNLRKQHGSAPLEQFRHACPTLRSTFYDAETLDLDLALDGADVVIVHEWNDPALVARIGHHRARGGGFRLLFHDTHHRAVSEPDALRALDLAHYDGVLAFGEVLRRIYEDRGWAARAWTWHEAADIRLFRPEPPASPASPQAPDLVWIGNWGDGERAVELCEFLIEPVAALGLRAQLHGVRYPEAAKKALEVAGIAYRGWLPNFHAPTVFAQARMTVHIPRRFYAKNLPGIPTIRVFEALACGIPLVCAPWEDCEHLFRPGEDYLVARNGEAMREHLRMLKASPATRKQLAESGLRRILDRHTCAHRVEELLCICETIHPRQRVPRARPDAARDERAGSGALASAIRSAAR
jgi:spore maturation protein CgeB